MNLMRLARHGRTFATGVVPVVIVAAAWLGQGQPALGWLAAGSVLTLLGQGLRLWAAGHLVKRKVLTITGPFGHTRHPLYWGSVLIGLGLCAASRIWWSYLLVALVFALFYLPIAHDEEKWLRRRYGELYQRYCRAVPRWGARWRPYRSSGGEPGAFKWERTVRNREQQTAAGTLLALAALWLRLWAAGVGG